MRIIGKARLAGKDLRCTNARKDASGKLCNALLAKTNLSGNIAGSFRCPKCKGNIEVL